MDGWMDQWMDYACYCINVYIHVGVSTTRSINPYSDELINSEWFLVTPSPGELIHPLTVPNIVHYLTDLKNGHFGMNTNDKF